MDVNNLSSKDAQVLIKEVKQFLENVNISIPLIGRYKLDEVVEGKNYNIEYRFHIYRGNINEMKYSLHLRFMENNIHLVRLCINGTNHKNYDGTKVGKNYIHVYKRLLSEDRIVDYAYDLNNFPFDENDELEDAVNKFSEYINLNL